MVVINSCAVTNETERQVRQTIRRIKKEYPDKKIVMTGIRDKILEETLKKIGAENSSSVTQNTFVLIAKSKYKKKHGECSEK